VSLINKYTTDVEFITTVNIFFLYSVKQYDGRAKFIAARFTAVNNESRDMSVKDGTEMYEQSYLQMLQTALFKY
jgi:hypothetical protein